MSQQLNVFKEQELLDRKFRIYGSPEEPLFLAKDVAEWIEYDTSQLGKMLKNVDENEKVRNSITTLGGVQETWFLTEDGLYEVLMQSRKPIAKEFKKEVKVIMKSVRKHGGYLTESKLEEVLLNPDTLIQLATNLKNEQEARKLAEQQKKEAELLAQQKEEVILEQKPKVDFVDEYVASVGLQKMGEVAKIFGIGRNSLYKMLRDANVLMGDNKPYQYYMNLGWFEVKTVTKDWKVMSVTLVTSKGIYGIAKKLNLLG